MCCWANKLANTSPLSSVADLPIVGSTVQLHWADPHLQRWGEETPLPASSRSRASQGRRADLSPSRPRGERGYRPGMLLSGKSLHVETQ